MGQTDEHGLPLILFTNHKQKTPQPNRDRKKPAAVDTAKPSGGKPPRSDNGKAPHASHNKHVDKKTPGSGNDKRADTANAPGSSVDHGFARATQPAPVAPTTTVPAPPAPKPTLTRDQLNTQVLELGLADILGELKSRTNDKRVRAEIARAEAELSGESDALLEKEREREETERAAALAKIFADETHTSVKTYIIRAVQFLRSCDGLKRKYRGAKYVTTNHSVLDYFHVGVFCNLPWLCAVSKGLTFDTRMFYSFCESVLIGTTTDVQLLALSQDNRLISGHMADFYGWLFGTYDGRPERMRAVELKYPPVYFTFDLEHRTLRPDEPVPFDGEGLLMRILREINAVKADQFKAWWASTGPVGRAKAALRRILFGWDFDRVAIKIEKECRGVIRIGSCEIEVQRMSHVTDSLLLGQVLMSDIETNLLTITAAAETRDRQHYATQVNRFDLDTINNTRMLTAIVVHDQLLSWKTELTGFRHRVALGPSRSFVNQL